MFARYRVVKAILSKRLPAFGFTQQNPRRLLHGYFARGRGGGLEGVYVDKQIFAESSSLELTIVVALHPLRFTFGLRLLQHLIPGRCELVAQGVALGNQSIPFFNHRSTN
jgi:hypothetical protein